MFDCEAAFVQHRKRHGQREAMELIADINSYTTLHSPREMPKKKGQQPSLDWKRCLFDRNEHFIELSNLGEEDRSLMFMTSCLVLVGLLGIAALAWAMEMGREHAFTSDWLWGILFGFCVTALTLWFNYMLWPLQYCPNFFTTLRARYRFNRTTGKVYVLRPARYGGNVILDWVRVQAHVNWCAPREMKHDDLRDPIARKARQDNGGGEFSICGLVLYWPPFNKDDPQRKGEDVLWVGPKLAGEGLWQYIRTFMEEGLDKVPEPSEYEWLRKGYHTPGQHIEETVLGPSRVLDHLGGRAEAGQNSALTNINFMLGAVWAPLHCLAERLCTWPTFPEAWNSDCGQRRREDGIGPEEPLRWTPKI